MSGAHGGPWTAEEHFDRPGYDTALAQAICDIRGISWLRNRLVLDLGCGLGFYCARFETEGATAIGVEPNPMHSSYQGRIQLITSAAEPLRLAAKFDLVLCIEVAEHIPQKLHLGLFENCVGHLADDGLLIFSGATPGQGGYGHVAEMSPAYWGNQLSIRGLVEAEDLSTRLRDAASLPWLKSNVTVWRRP